MFMRDKENKQYFITREEYNEYGAEYFKELYFSNEVISSRGSYNSLRDNIYVTNKKQKL